MLEKLGRPPARNDGAIDLYDWDELVQEDRVHRLIYTDPAIFDAEMTHIFGAAWVYLAPRKPDSEQRRLHHRASSGLRPIIMLRDIARQDPRALQPLHPSRHDAVPLGQGQSRASFSARITAGAFSTPASCAACRGRTAMPRLQAIRSSTSRRCRGSTAIAASSSARSISDAPPLLDYLGADHEADRRMARPQSRRQGRGLRGQPAQVQGQLEARLRQFRRRLSRRVFAPLAAGDGEPLGRREANKGMSYYKGSPDEQPMYMHYMGNGHHFKDKRPNIEKRAGGLWAVEGPHPGMEHYAAGAAPAAMATEADEHSRSRRLGAGQHQRVSEPVAARQPHPGVRAGLGRRDQCHLVRHHDRGRRRRARRGGRTTSTRCACARRSGSRISAKSTTSPISSRSSAALPASRTNGSTCTAASASPAACKTDADGIDHGAGHRRGVHARIYPRMEAADEDHAEPRRAAGSVISPGLMLRSRA